MIADPIEMVQRLQVSTATLQLPPDLAEWLSSGLTRFLSGEAPTLCAALGLRGPGRTGHVVTALRHLRRNHALLLAIETMSEEPDPPEALALAVRRFESCTWPHVRDLADPPARFNPTQRALFLAFQATAGKVPRSRAGIVAAVRQ